MEGFDHKNHSEQHNAGGIADPSVSTANAGAIASSSKGSSVLDSDLKQALDQTLSPDEKAATPTAVTNPDDHDHGPKVGVFETHVDLNNVANARSLNAKQVSKQGSFTDTFGNKGDFLNPGGGNNTVISGSGNDVIRGAGQGLNTITTGTGRDTIILGEETTNRIFDFDPTKDRFALQGINPKDIVIAQGKNPGKGGLEQPLDSVNNALVIDKRGGHILAALTFTKASDLNEGHFSKLTGQANKSLNEKELQDLGFASQSGNGQLTGTQENDRLIGGKGNDFLYVGNDGFKFNTAGAASGATEFPFKNDSPGSSEIKLELKDGVLRANGSYKNFDAAPLFSQGETAIDPKATILNGSDPVSLINNFLQVPKDVEGNVLSGTHLHFSPAEDGRGSFADATVVRFFNNTVIDPKSGTITGEFELKPEEQAALLAGNLYVNIHTNVDLDGDGKAGFPTGENRININNKVVQFA
ncbi:CHRD domain-containing protein [Phormidium sp. FACHB-592]|uniref:CHRD domain-containing protein n=1 Tax=Stenomitos frigidus AS-A4 TaxID=2933935 RepID=A0ABV0KIE5_9CYAN|nr:CHRD domain-containing protein [Phormidium sp. FACHB-592]MBD2075719.1 CHRD domain-containing protein [Phormidium sp. FACHB-592]